MKAPLRVAILECDVPIGRTKEKYGGYGNLFKELLERGAKLYAERESTDIPSLDITKFDVIAVETYPDLDNIDAVLLTGSSEFSMALDLSSGKISANIWLIVRIQFVRQRSVDIEVGRIHETSAGAESGPNHRRVLRSPDRGTCDGRQSQ